jgi:hypothetical protein
VRQAEVPATDPEVSGSIPGHYKKTEELLGRNSSGSGLEDGDYGRRDPSR